MVLVDSAGGLAEALDNALKEQGFPPAGKERVSIWVGNGADVMIERALTWAGATITPELHQATRDSFDKFYATAVTTGSELFPEVKETLEKLAFHNIPMAIVTNKPTPFIAPLLKKLAIDRYFSLVLGGDDVKEKSHTQRHCISPWASLVYVKRNCFLSVIPVMILLRQKAHNA